MSNIYLANTIRYEPYEDNDTGDGPNSIPLELFLAFILCVWQLTAYAIVFSIGAPYRKPIVSNCKQLFILSGNQFMI